MKAEQEALWRKKSMIRITASNRSNPIFRLEFSRGGYIVATLNEINDRRIDDIGRKGILTYGQLFIFNSGDRNDGPFQSDAFCYNLNISKLQAACNQMAAALKDDEDIIVTQTTLDRFQNKGIVNHAPSVIEMLNHPSVVERSYFKKSLLSFLQAMNSPQRVGLLTRLWHFAEAAYLYGADAGEIRFDGRPSSANHWIATFDRKTLAKFMGMNGAFILRPNGEFSIHT